MNSICALMRVGFDKISTINNPNATTTDKRVSPSDSTYNKLLYFLSDPNFIIDNIYLGSAYNAANYYTLKNINIDIIINVTNEITNYFPNYFEYKRYPVYDNNEDDITPYLEDFYQTVVSNKNKNIFLHCLMGASRSASFIIYYMMRHYGMNYNQALSIIKSKRQIVNPSMKLRDVVVSKINAN